jgi:predicted Zn-dependent peptidase
MVSGKVTDNTLQLIEKHFGCIPPAAQIDAGSIHHKPLTQTGKFLIEKQDALQSAIRIGKMLFNKSHSDYIGMLVLNTVFGGYFGSRLMSNIREDKGYTYGIGSAVVSFLHAGYFTISSEVGTEVTQSAIKEIYYELERIQSELISNSELTRVRNYMLGAFLRSIDGPFALADRFKAIYFYGLDYEYYDRYIETIKTITPAELRNLANKYLRKDEMIELVVGKK